MKEKASDPKEEETKQEKKKEKQKKKTKDETVEKKPKGDRFEKLEALSRRLRLCILKRGNHRRHSSS